VGEGCGSGKKGKIKRTEVSDKHNTSPGHSEKLGKPATIRKRGPLGGGKTGGG